MFPIKIAICGYPLFSDTPSVDRNPHGSTVGSAGDQQIIHPPRAASVFRLPRSYSLEHSTVCPRLKLYAKRSLLKIRIINDSYMYIHIHIYICTSNMHIWGS